MTWCFAKADPFGDLSDFNKYLIENGYDHDAIDLTNISFRPAPDAQKALDGQEPLAHQGDEVLPDTVAEPEEREKAGEIGMSDVAKQDIQETVAEPQETDAFAEPEEKGKVGEIGVSDVAKQDIQETVAEPQETDAFAEPEEKGKVGEIGVSDVAKQDIQETVAAEPEEKEKAGEIGVSVAAQDPLDTVHAESAPEEIATMEVAHHEDDGRWSLSDLLQLEVEDEEEDWQSLLEATVSNLSLPNLNAIKTEITNHGKFSQVVRKCEDEVNADCDQKDKWIWGESEEDLAADVECWVEQFRKLFPKTSSAMTFAKGGPLSLYVTDVSKIMVSYVV